MTSHRYWCAVESSAGVLGRSRELLVRPKHAVGRDNACTQQTQFTVGEDDRKCVNPARSSTENLSTVFHMEFRGHDRIVRSSHGTNHPPSPSATPTPPSSVQTALYIVIAIIVLFCITIVVLTVVIVLLRKAQTMAAGRVYCHGNHLVYKTMHSSASDHTH